MKAGSYDKISLFGLRPVELLALVPGVDGYYRWFTFGDELDIDQITQRTKHDVCECAWIDGLGRQLKLRSPALDEFKQHLDSLDASTLNMESCMLKEFLLNMIMNDTPRARFVKEGGNEQDLPIPVFSSITPHSSVQFLLHVMLMCGSYNTELDLRECCTMRESLVIAKLIGNKNDEESLKKYVDDMVKLTIDKVCTRQPISLRKLEDYLIAASNLFESVILRDELPSTDLPPCILTELLNDKAEELAKFWTTVKDDHLEAIYEVLPNNMPVPTKANIQSCTKSHHAMWDTSPTEAFVKSVEQSQSSYEEQLLAVTIAVRAIQKYTNEFGAGACTYTKGEIVHGVPGAGKSHVISYITLVALSLALRVMTTAIMGVRANAFGGMHFHMLLCLPTKTTCTPYRLAEISISKLHRKQNINLLHCLLTVDILIIDECGMLSAHQLSILAIILRKLWHVCTPFGGVLVFGTMDHAQFGAINGLPFLLSTHLITDFTLVGLKHAVRVAGDPELQKLQKTTRVNLWWLIENQ